MTIMGNATPTHWSRKADHEYAGEPNKRRREQEGENIKEDRRNKY